MSEHHSGTALEVVAPKLELGATYNVYITNDDDTTERYGPFHVQACKSKRDANRGKILSLYKYKLRIVQFIGNFSW